MESKKLRIILMFDQKLIEKLKRLIFNQLTIPDSEVSKSSYVLALANFKLKEAFSLLGFIFNALS